MSTTLLIPLLRLPTIFIRSVLSYFDIDDLIKLASLSKKSCELVKPMKVELKVNVYGEDRHLEIQMNSRNNETWKFKQGKPNTTEITTRIERKDTKDMFIDKWILSKTKSADLYPTMTETIRCLTEVLTCLVFEVNIKTKNLSKESKIEDLRVDECSNLMIIGEKCMENSELAQILENISATELLSISVPTNSEFKCNPNNFKSKTVNIDKKGGLVTPKLLFEMKCAIITIRDSNFDWRDCISFIWRWKLCNMEKLEKFEYLEIQFKDAHMLNTVIPKELKGQKWNNKSENQTQILENVSATELLSSIRVPTNSEIKCKTPKIARKMEWAASVVLLLLFSKVQSVVGEKENYTEFRIHAPDYFLDFISAILTFLFFLIYMLFVSQVSLISRSLHVSATRRIPHDPEACYVATSPNDKKGVAVSTISVILPLFGNLCAAMGANLCSLIEFRVPIAIVALMYHLLGMWSNGNDDEQGGDRLDLVADPFRCGFSDLMITQAPLNRRIKNMLALPTLVSIVFSPFGARGNLAYGIFSAFFNTAFIIFWFFRSKCSSKKEQ